MIDRFLIKKILKKTQLFFFFTTICIACSTLQTIPKKSDSNQHKTDLDLSGTWRFSIDNADIGVSAKWYNSPLADDINIPGSMSTNGKGLDVNTLTPWTGLIVDSAWFTQEDYAIYRDPQNIKIPYWLQPNKHYIGAAWYQRDIFIPENGFENGAELYIERCHWESRVWIDDVEIGMQNSLGTPHRYDLSHVLKPGKHQITIRIDNRIKNIDVGQNAHSISDHTQTNWNGMIGQVLIKPVSQFQIDNMQLFPDLAGKKVRALINIINKGQQIDADLSLAATPHEEAKYGQKTKRIKLSKGENQVIMEYDMGDNFVQWDEFTPKIYNLRATLQHQDSVYDLKTESFGMRELSTEGTQILINNKPLFLRGTLESCVFPKTGYPPTDVASWKRIFEICKKYGLNHVRFHSWCPPKAAFAAADVVGIYLQAEVGAWSPSLGEGLAIDQYIYEESERIISEYGNHPSFSLMAYGNEPGGAGYVQYLKDFVTHLKEKDSRRLYTSAAGWPVLAENDFNNIPEPRIQGWGEGLQSIINQQAPSTDYDWRDKIKQHEIPTISHEIGQWCVYPDFKEIKKYTGILKAKNFEIFRDKLTQNKMNHLAEDFLMASGKLQVLCYKADIEAALRTPNFGGFQLLDLHDFPGQGTALVGVLNSFWENKGYVQEKTFRQFSNSTVPLARFPKMVFLNNENFDVPIEVAHYGEAALPSVLPHWEILDDKGRLKLSGTLNRKDIPIGNNSDLGNVKIDLTKFDKPEKLTLKVRLNDFDNQWDFFVYPSKNPELQKDIYLTQSFDVETKERLAKGESVIYTLPTGTLKAENGGDIAVGFSSIFWNTAWTKAQPPVTLGILCDPAHPALAWFPTEYHSNWQWWDAMSHSNTFILDSIHKDLQPIVRVIDDWVSARPLGLLFECRIGPGKLLVSGIDLVKDAKNRPEARQLLYSLKKYMSSDDFNPMLALSEKQISDLVR